MCLWTRYDKPILDALAEPEVARANRNFLRGFYGMIKDCDEHIRFCLLTGVSKFSKAGLFSGLNNLRDITLSPAYATICGYTDGDLDTVFAPELDGLDRDAIRYWYNGYGWRGPERVYNPFDILLLFREREFRPYWFETGTPTFLVETLLRKGLPTPALDRMTAGEALLSAFDVERISMEALLFQTGYLTIVGEEVRNGLPHYRLGYPNLEVRQSLGGVLLEALLPEAVRREAEDLPLRERMAANDLAGVGELFRGRVRKHPAPVVHERPARGVRGTLRERDPLLLPDAGLRAGRGGQREPGPGGHGAQVQRSGVSFRVQGGGPRPGGEGAGAAEAKGLRGQVSEPGPSGPPDRGGVQPGGAQTSSPSRPRRPDRRNIRPARFPNHGAGPNTVVRPPGDGYAPFADNDGHLRARGRTIRSDGTCGMQMPYSRVCPAPRLGSPFDPERPGA